LWYLMNVSDFSPAEQNKRHQLVIELRWRLSEGETNLVIYKNLVIHRPLFSPW
uniref:Transposase n=1 Tax=Schistocephalus solidus TaxID=70667 RepID=A0A183S8J2_SCHSO